MRYEAYCNNILLGKQMKKATSLIDRLIGLMFFKEMKGFDSLLLEPCRSIHTFFMRYAIDVLFVDKDMKIVKIIREMKPWRMSLIYFSAHSVLEFKAGSLPRDISKNDQVTLKCIK